MKIKKGDQVKILTGNDKGKVGKVLEVRPKENKVVVEGVRLLWKHVRARRAGEKGQKIQLPGPIDISNVALICPKCNQATRVGFKVIEKRKLRLCRKCKEVID
jgi:large subunit ribosomal protein L24